MREKERLKMQEEIETHNKKQLENAMAKTER